MIYLKPMMIGPNCAWPQPTWIKVDDEALTDLKLEQPKTLKLIVMSLISGCREHKPTKSRPALQGSPLFD